MPYGVKRGVRPDGQYGIADIAGLALAGSAGIIAALVTDYQQAGEASALYTINQWVVGASKMFGFGDVPLWTVIVGLIGVGALSVFYFQPLTRQGAFAQGFGLLAVLMTAVPSDLGKAMQSIEHGEPLPGVESAAYDLGGDAAALKVAFNPSPAVYTGDEARVHLAQATRAARYDLHLEIVFEGGAPADIDQMIRRGTIRGRLHNEDTKETYNLFRSAGAQIQRRGDRLFIDAGIPARAREARLWIRIECENFAIEEQSTTATLGGAVDWRITMRRSTTPLFLQRLGKSYWF